MHRPVFAVLALPLLVTACGLGETAATATAVGTTTATTAAHARQAVDAVQRQLDVGAREAQDRLQAAEAVSQ